MGLTAALGLGSAIIGASSANSAADAQQAAGNAQVAESRAAREQTAGFFEPYRESGLDALQARNYLLGLGPQPTFGGTPAEISTRTIPGELGGDLTFSGPMGGNDEYEVYRDGQLLGRVNDRREAATRWGSSPSTTQYLVGDNAFATMDEAQAFARANPVGGTEYGGFQKSPGFDFRLQQGVNAVDMSAAARGGLNSGATLKTQTQFGQDYGSNEFNNYLAQITNAANSGQNAAGSQAASNQFYSGQINNSLAGIGNAQAAGAIGMGNALQGGFNNLSGFIGYQNALNASQGNTLFGGNSWG